MLSRLSKTEWRVFSENSAPFRVFRNRAPPSSQPPPGFKVLHFLEDFPLYLKDRGSLLAKLTRIRKRLPPVREDESGIDLRRAFSPNPWLQKLWVQIRIGIGVGNFRRFWRLFIQSCRGLEPCAIKAANSSSELHWGEGDLGGASTPPMYSAFIEVFSSPQKRPLGPPTHLARAKNYVTKFSCSC
jgi:hypothetical protein